MLPTAPARLRGSKGKPMHMPDHARRTLTKRSIGLPLRRKLLPVAEYFAGIEAAFEAMPTQKKMVAKKGCISKKWQRRFGQLVNAFGWNRGRTSKHASHMYIRYAPAEEEEEGVGEILEGIGWEVDAAVAGDPDAAAAMDPEHDQAPPPTEAPLRDPTIERDLLTRAHSSNPALVCAYRHKGHMTAAFATKEELFDWVWLQRGVFWRADFKTKQ